MSPPAALDVREAASIAARHAEEADTGRLLHPDVAEALVGAGFARHFVPATRGGHDGGAVELLEAVAEVGQECASAAWCASLAAGAARMGVFLPEEGQAELWADGPDVFMAGALIPGGRAERVAGGWRLTGGWDFTSGVDHSDWAMAAGVVHDGDRDRARFFAIPRKDYLVKDTWFNTGMRGTGSNTLLVDDVFVPASRSFDREDMLRGHAVGSTSPCHTAPLRAISGTLFAAPALGAARGALQAWSRTAAVRVARTGLDAAENRAILTAAAHASVEVDVAEVLLCRAARTCDRGEFGKATEVRSPYDCAAAVDRLVDAVERLFRTAGSRGQLATEPLQRFWRDLHSMASHVALQLDPPAAAYGRHLLEPLVPDQP
ncbi:MULTISPECIES: hydrolase [Saccharothrix]|uniref:hydrolase n=1 Tax=Saccharothrix TaxID=2071 RepID=UPI0009393708|nr:hydrolase [Saccharothrix sp. CB00851]OKI29941.1 hydrolase [Saccharothrix sp. CB00851]